MIRLVSRHPRTERGATTAEYVGIVAVVAALVIALFTLSTPVSAGADAVMKKAFCLIGTPFGFAGCSNDDLPGYVPTDCTVKSHEGTAGGGITIIASVDGESGYTLLHVRERQDDGSIDDKYVVETKGQLGAGYEFTLGGGASVDTGSGGASAKGAGSAEISGDVAWGKKFTFDSEDDANAFIDQYKGNFGEFGSDPDNAPDADSTYYELSGQGSISGELGPAEGSLSQTAVVGLEDHADGSKTVKAAMTIEGAAELGIPVPDTIFALTASGDASAMVMADLTFDKDGNIANVGGSIQLTAQAAVQAGVNEDLFDAPKGKHAKDTVLQSLELPHLQLEEGRSYNIDFSTDFNRDDGSYDYSAVSALSAQLQSYLTGGEISPEQAEALRDQLNNHSKITFSEYDYHKDEQKFGGEVKVLFVKVGGEVHMVTVDQNLLSGYYYDPKQSLWAENVVCDR